ncbi:MAG: hypothetical protein IKA93_03270 [Elusimicrobiaceae bacterium]|nr:hypothetical protein [Elusimicrobiaceae bacterium]
MTVPFNLLGMALGNIGRQSFWLLKWNGRDINAAGLPEDQYEPAVKCSGSIQSVQQDVYDRLGLSWETEIKNVWSETEMKAEAGQQGPDLLVFEGKVWFCKSITPWNQYNGWNQAIVVKAKPEQQHYAEGLND